MYKTILVAVDTAQMEKAERILRQAGQLSGTGGRILLVNVVEELPSYVVSDLSVDMLVEARSKSEAMLTELSEKIGVAVDIEIRQGAPAKEILAAADAGKADLIVIASHIPDFSNYIIGATADRIVRHAKCSVLIDR
jgi:nucleotide-binding universal stress UspA family protein